MYTIQHAPYRTILFVCTLWLSGMTGAIAQGNTPTSSGTVPAATGNTMPYVPSAYTAGSLTNYVRSWTARQPFTTAAAVTGNTQVAQVNMNTQYLDGLGNPLQNVNWQSSPSKTDMTSPVVYDAFGREQYKFLPYTSSTTDGSMQTNPLGDQNTFYSTTYPSEQPAISGEQFYYGHTQFEPSPLNRVQKTFAPGNSWAGSEGGAAEKSTQVQYLSNNANDAVQIWSISSGALSFSNNDVSTNIPTTNSTATFLPGVLYKTVMIDEHNHAVVEFKDLEGQVMLKKVQVGASIPADYSGQDGNWLCTYYVYDDLNQLRFVIPPKASALLASQNWQLDATTINELCFRYEYDFKKRMYAKKVPGAAWVYMIYDFWDRLVFTQDGNMRNNNQWLGILYDQINRPVETFMMGYTGGPSDLQSYVTANTGGRLQGSQTISGVTPSSLQSDLVISTRQTGLSVYQASNTISFNPEFTSEDGAEFSTDIELGNSGSFSNTIVVIDNPVPAGSTVIALTITNYDNYSNTSKAYNTSNNSQLDQGTNPYAEPLPDVASIMTMGLVTSKQVRVIENPADLTQGQWLETVSFFDEKARPVQIQQTNYKGGLDITTSRYDFTGKTVCSYNVHNNSSANISNLRIKTNMNYDHEGRLLTVLKNINDDANPSSPQTTQRTIATYVYDALGQLKEKKIGQKSITGSALSSDPLEDDSYAYNIRGWLKGMNWQGDGGGSATSSQVNYQNNKWFGIDLSYDWGFGTNQFNGNISGQRWISADDGAERSYGYGYDNVNRLLHADFTQNFNGSWSTSDPLNTNFKIDFSVKMGDGVNYALAYDENGNILAMQQSGLVINTSQPIDNLTYTYNSNSNKLSSVSDAAVQPVNMSLGDFRDKNTSGDDYGYDINGNLITDKNKFINGNTGIDQTAGGAIIYNHLNLPYQVSMQNTNGTSKGTITYIYDATGNKLEKRTNELASISNNNTAIQTTTSYLTGFQYQNNVLQFFGQEEGRIRPITPSTYNNNQVYAYDYLIKDHLSNTRAILTDELQQDVYPAATLETGGYATESNYYSINQGNIAATPVPLANTTTYANNNGVANPDPGINTAGNSQWMYRLNGSTGDKMGLGTTLKVMAGDNVTIFGKSYWLDNVPHIDNNDYNIVVNSLLGLLAGSSVITSSEAGITASSLTSSSVTPGEVSDWLTYNKPPAFNKPKAYINWILFDEQFRPVTTSIGSGFDAVGDAGQLKSHLDNVSISKSGYLYVYCSNESNVDVFFDNLQVVHTKGQLLENTHYYPFGLTMAGISDKAVKSNYAENKNKFNHGNELQSKEFSDGSGLDVYDAVHRGYDPQIGRFWQIDALADVTQNISPYAFANNNPTLLNDPIGLLSDSLHPQELPTYTVVGHKKQALVGFYYPSSSVTDRATYRVNQNTFAYRSQHNLSLIQKGDPASYVGSVPMYKRWKEEDQNYKAMQLWAVGILGTPILIEMAPAELTAAFKIKLGLHGTAFAVDAVVQTTINAMQHNNVFENYNFASGSVALIVGIPDAAPLQNIVGVSLLSSTISSSITISPSSLSGNVPWHTFEPLSILINTGFSSAAGKYSQFMGGLLGNNELGDGVAAPFNVMGGVVDQATKDKK